MNPHPTLLATLHSTNMSILESDYFIYLVVSIVVIVVVGFLQLGKSTAKQPTQSKPRVAEREKKAQIQIRSYTAEEVAKHNKRDDCWLIIDGKIYDVTPYVDEHLGGDAILRNAGKDSSVGFHGDQHPVKVAEMLWEFYVGDLKQ